MERMNGGSFKDQIADMVDVIADAHVHRYSWHEHK